jgi:predicted TIM-barrel fold metal-dependent hydrolase
MSRENVIISLDGHTHCFLDLKPWMPRQYHTGFDIAMEVGKRVAGAGTKMFSDMMASSGEMMWDAANDLHNLDLQRYHEVFTGEQRIARIDADGVAAEMLIDGFGPITTDTVLQHQITQGFIRWFQDYTSPAPYRFTAAVAVSVAAGMDVVEREIDMAWKNGIRAIHLPPSPKLCDPGLPEFNHYMYEPIWSALDERGMAVIWHPSLGREKPLWQWDTTQRGSEFINLIDIEISLMPVLKYFLLAGIPERYPNLKFGFIESGSTWIPPALKSLDRFFNISPANPEHKLQMKPSEQWARQGFAAGPLDARETVSLADIGVNNLAFGSDDIHTEGTWPRTRSHLAGITAHLSEEERWALAAGNAARLFNFDLDKLAQTKAAQVAWREAKLAA